MFSWRTTLRRRVHLSIFIAWTMIGIIAGVAVAKITVLSFASLSCLVIAGVILVGVALFRRAWMIGLALAAGLLVGLWRGENQLIKIEGYKQYTNQTVELTGVVSEDSVEGRHGDQQLEVKNVRIEGHTLPEKVWVSVRSKEIIKRSDFVALQGTVKPGFGSFAASMGFARLLKHDPGTDEARDVRDWFSAGVRKAINEPEASLGIGYIVGQRSSLPSELDAQLQMVGLTHIVVASGYNLTILVRLARRLMAPVSKYLTAVLGGSLIGGFVLVTGLSPSMSRAGLVAGLSLLAWYYGRKISPFVLLPFVAGLSVLVNPSYVWGDVGWYLSFAAFGGVMILGPLLQHYFFGPGRPGYVRQVLGETVSAIAMTLPIIMLVFGQYSLYALPANLLVVLFIPYAMLLVFIAGLGGLLVPGLGAIIGFPAQSLLSYMTFVVHTIASWPGALGEAKLPVSGVALYYATVFGVALFMWRKTKHNFRGDNIIE